MADTVEVGALQFTAPNYIFNLDHVSTTIDGAGVIGLANAATFNVVSTVGATPAINFNNFSSAGTAHFILGQVVDTAGGFNAGFILFTGNSTAGQATIEVRDASSTNFFNSSTADHATIIVDRSGFLGFNDQSNGDQATVINNAGGEVGLFGLSTAGTTLGSIAGDGTFTLTDKNLTVGSNNSSTEVGGIITGDGGSLVKVGTGTLTLSGANTYTGGTTISQGAIAVSADNRLGASTGALTFNGGTLRFDSSFDLSPSRVITLNAANGGFAGGGTFDTNGFTTTVTQSIQGAGSLTKAGDGTLILANDNPYAGGTTVTAGTLAVGDFAHSTAALSGGGPITVGSGGTLGGYGSVTGDVTNSGVIAPGSATPGLSGSPMGAFTINGNYTGAGGTMAINTVLGGSGSTSDLLVISGGAATGNTIVHVTNVGGVGGLTPGNGIQVVEAVNGATTSPGAFALPAGELRAGAFDYDLLRGGLGASNRQDWFLRSDFVGGGGGGVPLPIPPFPIDPPPNPLPPNVLFPIIGPELATYGAVQPLARQLGLSILGTLDDRVGDTYEPDGCAVAPAVASAAAETSAVDLPTKKPGAVPTKKPGPAPCPLFSPSVWGRFFGQTIHNNYQAFAAPSASGDLGGFQGGIDLLRGSLIAGQYERAGLYGAYGDVHA